MKPPSTLAGFLQGPLSDRFGGSDHIRNAVVSCYAADKSLDDEHASKSERRIKSFVLAPREPLFSYQKEIVDQLDNWLVDQRRRRAALVSLPTGGGKTRVGIWFLRKKYEEGIFKRLLWIAPSSELVDQAVETLHVISDQFPGKSSICVNVNEIPTSASRSAGNCSFVTAQLAVKRLRELKRYAPDILVFDEAHQAVARTFQEVIRTQLTDDRFVVGLSATPGRSVNEEGLDLQEIFGNNLIISAELGKEPVAVLRERGVLSKLEMELIALPPQWTQIRVKSLKSRTMSIDELALHPSRFWATVDTICNLESDSRTLVFGASLAHCFALNGVLRSRGVLAETLSHNTPPGIRASIIRKFADGEISVLLNKTLLATGYDCPGITDVVLASPIRSPILWEQILGRASRGPAVGGTERGCIWELDDHRELHGQVMSYARFLGDLWSK